MSDTLIILTALVLPIALAIVSMRGELRYEWKQDSLVVRTGISKFVFPYSKCIARVTSDSLGTRVLGTAASNIYVGKFITSSGEHIYALADTKTPGLALLLSYNGEIYYLTPSDIEDNIQKFYNEPYN